MISCIFSNISFSNISNGDWLEFSGTIISALIGFLGTILVIHYTINNAKELISHDNKENNKRIIATAKECIKNKNNSIDKLKPKLRVVCTRISIDNMNENIDGMKDLYNFCKDIISKLEQISTNISIYQNEIINNVTKLSKFNESYYDNLNDTLIYDYSNYHDYIETTIKLLEIISFHSKYNTGLEQGFKNADISETLMPKLRESISKLSHASYIIRNSSI